MMLQVRQSVTPHSEGWWDWAVWLDGPEDVLDEVELVEYVLHPTFPNPVRKVDDRATNFRLESRGWGEFNIIVRVHLEEDEMIRLEHWLELDDVTAGRIEETGGGPRERRRKHGGQPILFVSSAVTDMRFTYELKDALEDEGLEVLMSQDLEDDRPLEIVLETEHRSIQAGLFVVSDVRNPTLIRDFWAIRKNEIASWVVQIGEPRELPDEMQDLPRFQIKDVSETRPVASSIAHRIRDRI